jgi:hypothetical protein
MSTPNETPNPAQQPGHDARHDEHSGAFGFFRKYQKLILYTAVLFALVTFSISGAMMQFFRNTFSPHTIIHATVTVNGVEHALAQEDYEVAGMIVGNLRAVGFVLPDLGEDSGNRDLRSRLAALRRITFCEGFDVSMAEVDKAIDALVAETNLRQQQMYGGNSKVTLTPTYLALAVGMTSLAQFRDIVREAMRIGNYVRLNSIGVDGSDAALLDSIIAGQEKITLKVAQFDMGGLAEDLKKKGGVTDDDFKKWLVGKTDAERAAWQIDDSNHVSLLLGLCRLEPFNPEQWKDELKDFKFSDDQLKQVYEQEKEARFKLEKPVDGKKWLTLDDKTATGPTVKEELTKAAQIDEVLNGLLKKLNEQQKAAIQPQQDALNDATKDKMLQQARRDQAKAAADAKPDDAALKQTATESNDAFIAKENWEKQKKTDLEEARKAFDFRGKFTELTKDKAGFEVQEVKPARNIEELKDLKAEPLALGEWKDAVRATSIQNVGEIGGMPARTPKGGFLFQVTELVIRPQKPWDKIRSTIETQYFIEATRKAGDDAKKKFEEQLLELAKAKIPDKVKEIEAKKAGEVEKRFNDWKTEQTRIRDESDKKLAELPAGLEARRLWQVKHDAVVADLGNEAGKRTQVGQSVGTDLDNQIKEEAKKKYAEVMDAAAAAAGFTVSTFKRPVWREASSRVPGFAKQPDKAAAFLMHGEQRNMSVGDVSDILEDTLDRRWLMAVCDAVDPLQITDVPHKEFEQKRLGYTYDQGHNQWLTFGESEVRKALAQSFSMDALKARYKFTEDKPQVKED